MNILNLITTTLFATITLWTSYQLAILIIGSRISITRQRNTRTCSRTISKGLPFFSIIVPTKDEESVISRCIEALLSQIYPRDKMKIIIVDGSSKDATKKICESYARETPGLITIIEQKGMKGKPSALNDGLHHCTGDIVGVFDADNVPDADILMKVARCFEDRSIEALQGRTDSLNEEQNRITKIAAIEERIWLHTVFCRDRLRLFVSLTGSCQFVRCETLKSLGGWREDSLAEDVDLALRLTEKGHLIKFEGDAKSRQETPSSIKNLFKQRLRWYTGYLENLPRYGRLIKKPSGKRLDAEIILLGPGIMAFSVITFLVSIFQLLLLKGNAVLPSKLSVVLTTLSLILIGLLLAYSEKPFRFRNLIWLPIIYLYWLLQSFISCWALAQLLFRRPKVWSKTEKDGTITEPPFLGEKA